MRTQTWAEMTTWGHGQRTGPRPKDRGHGRNEPQPCLDLRPPASALPGSRTPASMLGRNKCLFFQHPVCGPWDMRGRGLVHIPEHLSFPRGPAESQILTHVADATR